MTVATPQIRAGFYAEDKANERPQVALKYLGEKWFRQTSSFVYVDREGHFWPVRAHVGEEKTDFASSPPWLWGVTAAYGRQLYPALLHDRRSADAVANKSYKERREADLQFREALRVEGLGPLRAGMFWAAVTLQRQFKFGRWPLGMVFGVQLLVAFAGFWGALLLGARRVLGEGLAWPPSFEREWSNPMLWALAFLAGILVLPLAQGKDYLAGVAGGLCAPFVLVVLLTTFVAAFLLSIPDLPFTLRRKPGGGLPDWDGPVPWHQIPE